MVILLVIVVTVCLVGLLTALLYAVKFAVELMQTVQKSASETVVTTISESMAAIFGKQNEPVTQLPGNEEVAEADEHYFPDHELDELGFPGSAEEIANLEAGWVQGQTNPPNAVD